jgi:hypothetical protein
VGGGCCRANFGGTRETRPGTSAWVRTVDATSTSGRSAYRDRLAYCTDVCFPSRKRREIVMKKSLFLLLNAPI